MRQHWADYRVFWREFRHTYHSTGAVLPSGPALASALCRYVRERRGDTSAAGRNGSPPQLADPSANRRILEVGPGTGAVTGRIIEAMRPGDRLVLVERNEQFVTRLRERLANDPAFRRVADQLSLVHASVEGLAEDQPFDVIISGLPLNNFSLELVQQILAKLRCLLARGGTLSFFEYVAVRKAKSLVSSHAERKRLQGVARLLSEVLRESQISRDLVLANVPPAWVHHVRFSR